MQAPWQEKDRHLRSTMTVWLLSEVPEIYLLWSVESEITYWISTVLVALQPCCNE